MRLFSICRNCAEVHPVEIECPACHPVAHMARPVARSPRRARDQAASLPALEPAPSHRLLRASTVVVSAYLLAVLVLILAVVAQA